MLAAGSLGFILIFFYFRFEPRHRFIAAAQLQHVLFFVPSIFLVSTRSSVSKNAPPPTQIVELGA